MNSSRKRKIRLDTRLCPARSKHCPTTNQCSASVNVTYHRRHHHCHFNHRTNRATPLFRNQKPNPSKKKKGKRPPSSLGIPRDRVVAWRYLLHRTGEYRWGDLPTIRVLYDITLALLKRARQSESALAHCLTLLRGQWAIRLCHWEARTAAEGATARVAR